MDQAQAMTSSNHRPRSATLSAMAPFAAALVVLLSPFIANPAMAQAPVFQNGTFSQALINGAQSASQAAEFGTINNGFTPTQQLIGWTTAGYNFVFLPATADTSGTTGQYGALTLWGPDNGGTNAALLPLSSPTGGDYIGADGAFEVSPISQTITGLTEGESVAVSFSWAGAQQAGYQGPTTDEWTVSLGTTSTSNPSQTTPLLSLPTEGTSAWMHQTFTFVATGSSELLSFLATGTPSGQPPFALLANVTVTNAPEPTSLAVMLTGIAGLSAAVNRRRRVAAMPA